ncbi:hypothetical protein G8J22_00650 [Lentilactobacillus hilgardii]|uniref:ABC-2 transporter permease n=1 Tax=Lentilactobacillus hilgardii TaxID=1588 RepID=UPI00019C4C4B|nr:ABC-2 transporter permease [Lentilactobacillus hilgardii]EEI20230.1 hypothetical protein HMPREF0497_0950 [Lentilactobacillus buchneri ATCC 11577]MCT3396332.1 ABC-2 transporter permease [Lentilactobacillus hilgardii]QIR08716.1 hypothetical protein G8J22_00650 [Lentilactobacillus hilgardii]
MNNVRKVMRLDAATWPLRINFWWLIVLIDVGMLLFSLIKLWRVQTVLLPLTSGLTAGFMMMPFYSSRKSGIDGLMAIMPFQRREIVLGHFLYGLERILALNLNLIAIDYVTTLFFQTNRSIMSVIWMDTAVTVFFILLLIVAYPLILGLDYPKTLMLVMGVMVGLEIISMYVIPVVGAEILFLGGWLTVLGFGVLALTFVLALGCSIWLSIRLYETKDF